MKVLMISHGKFAEGLYQSVSMICGMEPAHVDYLGLQDGVGVDQFEQELSKKIDEYSTEKLIVVTDIRGGSPFNTAIKLLSEKGLLENSQVICGMNLPLLINLALASDCTAEDVERIIQEARDGINKFVLEIDEEEDL